MKNRIANRILTAAANLLYGARITDEATAYKAFRTAFFADASGMPAVRVLPGSHRQSAASGPSHPGGAISYNARGIAEGKKIRARDGLEALWTFDPVPVCAA